MRWKYENLQKTELYDEDIMLTRQNENIPEKE